VKGCLRRNGIKGREGCNASGKKVEHRRIEWRAVKPRRCNWGSRSQQVWHGWSRNLNEKQQACL